MYPTQMNNRNHESLYPQHIAETRALMREMLIIMSRQDQQMAWMDRARFQNAMQEQRNRNQQVPLTPSPVARPRPRGLARQESRPTLADILTAAIMTELGSSMSPVVVRPTSQVIANATETIPFADIPSPQYHVCPISHEDFNNNSAVTRIRYCGHYFDPQAIGHWLSTSVRCPVCRHDIRDGGTPSSGADSAAGGSVRHTEEVVDEVPETNDSDIVEHTTFINPNDPASLASFMDLVTRDIQANGGSNTSLQFEFVPQFINASTLLDGSGNRYDLSGGSFG